MLHTRYRWDALRMTSVDAERVEATAQGLRMMAPWGTAGKIAQARIVARKLRRSQRAIRRAGEASGGSGIQLGCRRRLGGGVLERETRFELATSCLEGRRSTTELLPLA